MKQWDQQGLGWHLDGFFLSAVCYADDILLFASSKTDLETMLCSVIEAFAVVGLEVGLDKCHWTSFPAKPRSRLICGSASLVWEDRFTFIGTVLDFGGNDSLAIEHRIAQATKVFYKWRRILQCRAASRVLRVTLGISTFIAAALWLAETWHPTETQKERFNSWAARMMARLACLSPESDETRGDFWRRLHRTGHALMTAGGGSLDVLRRQKLHAFAGHLARMPDGIVNTALHTRCLAWWREAQNRKIFTHPRRFHVWRWEDQLVSFFGESKTLFVDEDVGWMAIAQDRGRWRQTRNAFAERPGVIV